MLSYEAPLRDLKFLFEDVFDYYGHYRQLPQFSETTSDVVDAILRECAKFSENELLPLSKSGNQEDCRWDAGKVVTPKGFKAAYQRYVEGGWQSLPHAETYGGQGLSPR